MNPLTLQRLQRWLLYLLVLALPLVITPSGRDIFRVGKEVFAQIVIWIFICLFTAESLQTRQVQLPPRTLLFPLAAFCLWCGAAVFWSAVHPLALYAFCNLLLFCAFTLMLVRLMKPEVFRFLVVLNLGPAAFTGAYTIVQYFGRDPLLVTPEGMPLAGRQNAGGLIGDVNTAGCYLAVSLVLGINVFFLEQSRIRKAGVLLACVPVLAGLLFTQTLTALAAAALGVLALFVLNTWLFVFGPQRTHRRTWLVLLSVMLIFAAGVALFGVKSSRFHARLVTLSEDFRQGNWARLTSYRAPIFSITWRMAREHPVWGLGLHSFETDFYDAKLRYLPGERITMAGSIESTHRQTHNEYLQVLAEVGAIGLLILAAGLAAILWRGVRGIFKSADFERCCLLIAATAGLVTLLVSALSFFPAHLALTSVWIALVIASVAGLAESEPEAEPRRDEKKQARRHKAAFYSWKPLAACSAGALLGAWFLSDQLTANRYVGDANILIEQAMAGAGSNERFYLEQSLQLLRFARRKNQLDSQIYQSAGTAHWFLAQYDRALENFSYAALLDPSPEAFTNLGETYRALGQMDLADRSFQKALAYNPDFEKARNAKALLGKKGL
jgi:O-antigen ligase